MLLIEPDILKTLSRMLLLIFGPFELLFIQLIKFHANLRHKTRWGMESFVLCDIQIEVQEESNLLCSWKYVLKRSALRILLYFATKIAEAEAILWNLGKYKYRRASWGCRPPAIKLYAYFDNFQFHSIKFPLCSCVIICRVCPRIAPWRQV